MYSLLLNSSYRYAAAQGHIGFKQENNIETQKAMGTSNDRVGLLLEAHLFY